MGRKRVRDADLPERVYFHHGAYRYKTREGKWLPLGADRGAVERELAKLTGTGLIATPDNAGLKVQRQDLGAAMDIYERDELPKLAAETQKFYKIYLKKIRPVFAHALPDQVRPKHIYAFRQKVSRSKGVQKIVTTIFQTLYRNMIEWGWADVNPAREVRREGSKRRRECPDATALAAFKRHCRDPLIPLYVDFKLSYGLRQKDLLELPPIPLSATEFVVEISKSKRWDETKGARVGETVSFEVTPETREILRAIYALGRPQNTRRLFCTRRGGPFSGDNFRKHWKAQMARYLAAEPGAKAFHEHDLRATTGTADPANAQRRLTHKNKSTTDGYLRTFEGEVVKPLELAKIPSKTAKIFPTTKG